MDVFYPLKDLENIGDVAFVERLCQCRILGDDVSSLSLANQKKVVSNRVKFGLFLKYFWLSWVRIGIHTTTFYFLSYHHHASSYNIRYTGPASFILLVDA